MPPQQISPSAASRSPWSSAILHASRKVSAMRFWLPIGSSYHAATGAGRVEPHDAVGADAQPPQPLGDAASLADLGEELRLLGLAAHGRAAAGRPPHRRHHRADLELPRPGLVGQLPDLVVAGVDVDVRDEEEQVEAVEPDALELGVGRQVEHGIEVDGRLAAVALAHHAGPRRIVKFRIVVGMLVGHGENGGKGSGSGFARRTSFLYPLEKFADDAIFTDFGPTIDETHQVGGREERKGETAINDVVFCVAAQAVEPNAAPLLTPYFGNADLRKHGHARD